MSYRTEFPDFAEADMPEIPEGFTDRSWRNEPCPCFIHEASGVVLWIDFSDIKMREFGLDPESLAYEQAFPRFNVQRCTSRDPDAGWQFDGGLVDLFASDDWETVARSLPNFILPHALALAFVMLLHADLSAEQWQEMRRRNATYGAGVCASHDFCDANMVMAPAFEEVMGREIDLQSDSDLALWSQAWDIAKTEHLTATREN